MSVPVEEAPRVLVIDDDRASQMLVAQELRQAGYQVEVAGDGPEGLARMRAEAFDLVILEGHEVLASIVADDKLRSIPVVVVTKPIDAPLLLVRVSHCIEIKRELDASYARSRELERMCDSLTHMIVHDLRTPLTSMLASVKTVIQLGDTLTDERKGRLLQLALRGGDALVGMIDDLLDVHKLEGGGTLLQRAPGDLAATISRACEQITALAERGGVDIIVERPDAIGQPSFDAIKIERVLVNLLGNAVKATGSHGKVTVSVVRAADAVSITVADTGMGIAPEHLGRIFEKFYRVEGSSTEHASSGLGLTFCKLMVEAHGGTIEASSTLGAGTRITFTLPV